MDTQWIPLLILLSVCTGQSLNPGLKLRITNRGLKYASDVAVSVLSGKVQGQRVPDQSGSSDVKVGKVSYSFTGMQITSFNRPASDVRTVAGVGLQWSASGAGMTLHGDWRYEYKLGWIKIKDHGSFDITLSSVSFNLGVSLGRSASGKPTIRTTNCHASVASARVKFHGGASWLYNIFAGAVEKKIKSLLADVICNEGTKAVNEDAQKALSKMSLTAPLGDHGEMLLDYSLTSNPKFSTANMETYHKGEVSWKAGGYPHVTAPTLPALDDNGRMLYVWGSSYVLQTLAETAQTHGILQASVKPSDVPISARGTFNTTCSTVGPCFGGIVPQLGKAFPNTTVSLKMFATSTPNVTISPRGVFAKFRGNIKFYANKQGSGDKVYAFTANMSLTAVANASINAAGDKILAKVAVHRMKVGILDSKIGHIEPRSLQIMMPLILNWYVLPKLNELGQKGIPIPKIDHVNLVNPTITLLQNAILVSSDVQYHNQQSTLYYI